MKLYKIFLILINYNKHDDTLKCLESIKVAGYGKNVVVVDNNSELEGVEKITERYPDTVLLKNHENIGFGRANNVGIQWVFKNTDCDYIFILNNDTTIEKSTIPELISVLKSNNNAALAAPLIVMMDNPDIIWYGGGEINWYRCSANIKHYFGNVQNIKSFSPEFVSFASGCSMLFKRKDLERLGGFDKRFYMYVEDLELCLRVLKSGRKIIYNSKSVVYHKAQGSQRSEDTFYSLEHPKNKNLSFYCYHLTKNRILTIKMHATGINALKFWSFFPFYLCAKSFQYLVCGRFDAIKAIFCGIIDSLKMNNQQL